MTRRDQERADDRPEGTRGKGERGERGEHGRLDPDELTPRERPPLTDVKGAEVTSSDEAADPSVQNAQNPMLVREEVGNTSDSSGLHADDEARGKRLKEQLKQGMKDVRPMD